MTAFKHCRFCGGSGCLACPGEEAKAAKESQEPIFVAKTLEDVELLKTFLGREAVEKAWQESGGDTEKFNAKIRLGALIAKLMQLGRSDHK